MPKKVEIALGKLAQNIHTTETKNATKSGTTKGGVLQKFVFEGDQKVAADNKRLLRRMTSERMYEQVQHSTRAVDALSVALRFMDHIRELDQALLDSKLLRNSEELQSHIAEQEKLIQALTPIRAAMQRARARRIRETVELEKDLEREAFRQQRSAQAAAKEKKKKNKTAAPIRLEPHEEDGSPTLNLDPTLLAEATKALTLEPDSLFPGTKQAKTTGKSKKKHTKP